MEVTVLQSPSCGLHEGLGGAGVWRSTGSDVPVHPCLGLAQGVCISKLPRTGVSPGKLSQTDELSCLQTAEPGVNLACLTDQNSFPSLVNI